MKTYNKSEIMKRAWRRFRVHSGETFGQSLKWSWDKARSIEYIVGEDVRDNEFKGCWAAHISGLNPQYGFSRTFVSDREKSRSSSRHAYYTVSVTLSPGQVYELCEKYDRKFVTIRKGEIVELSKEDVKNHFV